jgi:hypothetical protein
MKKMMNAALSPALAMALLAGAYGCADANDALVATMDDVPILTLTREAQVEDAAMFQGAGQITVAPNGDLILSQQPDPELLVIAPDGKIRHRIGRRGAGPGEFEFIRRFGFLGDTIWVFDFNLRRTSLFSHSGQFLDLGTYGPMAEISWDGLVAGQLHDSLPSTIRGPAGLAPGGIAVVIPERRIAFESPRYYPYTPVLATDRELRPTRVLALAPTSDLPYQETRGAPHVALSSPFAEEVIAVNVSPYGDRVSIVTADYSRLQIRVLSLSFTGDTLADTTLPFTPRPVTDKMIDEHATEAAKGWQRPEEAKKIRAVFDRLPRIRTPFYNVMSAPNGSIWLVSIIGTSHHLLLVDSLGRVGGKVVVPGPRQFPVGVGTDHIWVVEADLNDELTLVRYRISMPADSARQR